MAIRFKNRKNKLLAMFLALMMSSSIVAMAACDNSDDSSSSDSSSSGSGSTVETDTSRINNGSFEYVNWDDSKNLIVTSPTGWSRSTNSASTGTAVGSKSASGIINTEAKAWDNLTKSSLPTGTSAPKNAEEAAKVWDKMSAYDKLKFYEVWEDGDFEEKIEDQDFYNASTDKFSIDVDDVPTDKDGKIIENPGTHANSGDDNSILMIHNAYTDGKGTAQKFTSSSTITLQAGTSAEVSLWVKTSNLTYYSSQDGVTDVVSNKGAYIGITHTVGGKTLDQMQVKNINTENMEGTDNGWVQYTFYLQGCSFSSSTFTMVLGLGQSGGTDRLEYVEGYAFFDDVECKIISNEAYNETVDPNAAAPIPEVTLDTEAKDKIFLADKDYKNVKTYALNMNSGNTKFETKSFPVQLPIGLTEQVKNGITYVAADDGNLSETRKVYNGLGFNIDNDVRTVATMTALKAESATKKDLATALKSLEENYPFDKDKTEILMFLSSQGANYTAKTTEFTLDKGEKIGFSFFVKTSDMGGVTGANVTVRYGLENSKAESIASIDTVGATTIDTDEQDDIYSGWQQCFLFVENDTEADDLTFTMEFSYGPATVFGTNKDNFRDGWAAFANLQTITDEQAYDYASAGTYSKKISLIDTTEKTFSSSVFDSEAYVTGTEDIKTGIADLRNYTGVKGGSGWVNNDPNADRSKNSNDYAGLISKEYIGAYVEEAATAGADYWMNKMGLDEAGLNKLFKNGENTFGSATKPLLIYNNEKSAYGFIANSASEISAATAISVRVKVSAGATANVYLVDMSDDTHESVLSIDRRVSYWYDADGNVCSKDPASEDFDKNSDVLLTLEKNGLYSSKTASGYYANLKAYPEYGTGKDLLVAEGGVEYNYNSYWNNDGVDGIAYYYKNGAYYADSAKTVPVKDFSELNVPTRYDAVGEKDLSVTVTDTNGAWKTVTFYVMAGSEPKNYRLEVWSGSRDGKTQSEAGSYVLFDTNTAGNLAEDSFKTLTQDAFDYLVSAGNYEDEDALIEAYKLGGKLMYNAYSFYDDAKFLRYNSDLDENEVENSYDDYDPTADTYAEVLSYLYYENAKNNTVSIFANFARNDMTVPVDVVEDENETDTPEEETPETDLNLGMLISSLAVAGVLVAVLVIIGVRKAIKWNKKRAASAARTVRKPAKKEKAEKKDESAND